MDIDLFLFGSAFTETWKLQKGMVIVLLNPGIFKRKDGKGFNLRMNENKTPLGKHQQSSGLEGGESVLEVGFSRDWTGCEALKADGTQCGDWVDTRHTKICEYHVDQGMKRARKGRMEYAVGYVPPPPSYVLEVTYAYRMRAFSPKKEKEPRNPFAPRKVNEKNSKVTKKERTSVPDRWDGGGGSVYHAKGTGNNNDIDTTKKHIDGIKRDLKGSEREREIRRIFKSFAPLKQQPTEPNTTDKVGGIDGEEGTVSTTTEETLSESKAFNAKRVRQIGFDPRRKVNEEAKLSEKKVLPIIGGGGVGQRISLDGVLGGNGEKSINGRSHISERDDMDSDSDSDLDIVMAMF